MANEVNKSIKILKTNSCYFNLAPFMRRSWKAYYASLRDMVLYLHKNDQQPATILVGDTNALRLHHAFAQEAIDYRKRQHVFRLKTADWAEYLFQTSDHDLMKKWIDAINLIAASFSSPPLSSTAIIDSSSIHFQRPLLPSVQTRYSVVRIFDKSKNKKTKVFILV
jgi:PH/SEC7 domain-containing protein